MLLNQDSRVCVLTPPKCGSSTLHKSLRKVGFRSCLTKQFDGNVEKHGNQLPWEVTKRGYKILLAVRDPMDRVLSLFSHHKYWWNKHAKSNLEEFLLQIVVPPRYTFFNVTCSMYQQSVHDQGFQVAGFIRLEKMVRLVGRIGARNGTLPIRTRQRS